MAALQEKLPQAYWVEINALLVPFGKHVCTGVRPKCSTCPLLDDVPAGRRHVAPVSRACIFRESEPPGRG